MLGEAVRAVRRADGFVVMCEGAEYRAPALVVATGGLSIPKMGATGFGYELARQFGHSVVEMRPALVPLVLAPREAGQFCELAGISAEVVTSIGRQRFREKLLITHRGLSGPAVLQISSYWDGKQAIAVDWAPGRELAGAVKEADGARRAAALRATMREVFSQRLADRLAETKRPAGWSNQALEAWEAGMHRWEFIPAGTEGYEKAEVTAGGVNTDELSAKTMESRRVSGLYFTGEVVDVTGQLGGFNFQWAWASGAAAGRSV
jgi:predicted Rossmann fold flavoprotein